MPCSSNMLTVRVFATNDFLYKMGIKQSDSCTFCGETTENLVHLLWSCKYSNAFWKDCYQWIMQNTSKVERAQRALRKFCQAAALQSHYQ